MNEQMLWIGLANIIPKEGSGELSNAKGAYTNIIVYASSENDFIDAVKIEFDHRGYCIIDIEDIELFSDRAKKYLLRDELLELAKSVDQINKVAVDRLHLYD